MARIRSVKPEYWTDMRLARLSRDARLLYIAMWNQADEWCRLHGDPRYIKGHCLPYDDDLGLGAVTDLLTELERAGRIRRYEVDGDPFIVIPRLGKHQRLEPHKVPSRLPEPPDPDLPPSKTEKPAKAGDATSSARRSDEVAPDPESSGTIVALHVAGSRLQVAGDSGKSEPSRPDVDALCERLVELMVGNGCTRPNITKGWRDAARLLIDKDGRALDDALALLDWCQRHDFWSSVIQSLPTFREKYDRLRLQRDGGPKARFGISYGDDDREGPSQVMSGAEWATQTPRSTA